MIEVTVIKCLSDNYSYIIADKDTGTIGVIDPSEFEPIDIEIDKNYKKLDFILNTHHHGDHTDGNMELKEQWACIVVGAANDAERIPGIDVLVSPV